MDKQAEERIAQLERQVAELFAAYQSQSQVTRDLYRLCQDMKADVTRHAFEIDVLNGGGEEPPRRQQPDDFLLPPETWEPA